MAHAAGPWRAGVSVVIPERDAPAMLGDALASLEVALADAGEPSQVIVVANGAPRERYAGVAARFRNVEWIHRDAALGFAGAIELGLAQARFDGCYLMNNDMTLDPRALSELLPLRGERVFAIGSQILQQGASGRREETGFTDWYADAQGIHLFHAPPPQGPAPHVCASGGAALFRTDLLRRYLPGSRAFDPFYWEDVEWSVRARRDGFEVLFCPASLAAHRHRATTSRFYDEAELARIVERNRVLFDLRHGAGGMTASQSLDRVCDLPYRSQRELSSLRQARGVAELRDRGAGAPSIAAGASLTSSYSFRLREPSRAETRVLFVTPFATFPPRHGGARRIAALAGGLKDTMSVALLTDEASLHDPRSFPAFDGLRAVWFVQRVDGGAASGEPARDIGARMREHCHASMVSALRRALRDLDPHVVVIEHAELAPLVRERSGSARWVLDLHDAYAPGDFADAAAARAFAEDLARYDALVVCSEEDGRLVDHPRVVCVPNGAQAVATAYAPSTSAGLVFVGPFRYAPNREGILRFLREAWPAVRAAVPEATLTVLGGDESLAALRSEPLLAQEGVTVLGHRDDVPALIAASAIAINPIENIRGSAVKLVESLAAGRVCVTTRDGARGFARSPPPALVIVPDVTGMAAPVIALLRDEGRRHALEKPDSAALDAFGWHHSVARLRALFMEIVP